MKIGLVGYQGSGKSTLFEWLTGVKPDPALSHTAQSAMAAVPEPRVEALLQDLQAEEDDAGGAGAGRYAGAEPHPRGQRRPAGPDPREPAAWCWSWPPSDGPTRWPTSARSTRTWCWPTWRSSPAGMKRVEDSLRKPLPKQEHEQLLHEQATLEDGAGRHGVGPAAPRGRDMTDEQLKVTRSFRLLERKAARGGLQHGRRRAAPGAVHRAGRGRRRRVRRARRPGTGTGEDEPGRTGPSSSGRWAWAAPTATA